MSLVTVAGTLLDIGGAAEALSLVDRALQQEADAPEHPRMVWFLNVRALALRALGRAEEALAVLGTARALAERVLGPEHRDLGMVLHDLGETELLLGLRDRARATLVAADAIASRTEVPELERAQTWFTLARALGPKDRAQARAHAERALAAYVETGLHPERRRVVEAWLADLE
jgi:tetratricopeptide (TPR) repeat protein